MSGIPVLAIIVLAPVAGALLIMLFGRGQNAPKGDRAGRGGRQSRGSRCGSSRPTTAPRPDTSSSQSVPWIPSLGITFTLGVDGISVPMLVLTSLIVFTGRARLVERDRAARASTSRCFCCS